jgi:hypothetical protein
MFNESILADKKLSATDKLVAIALSMSSKEEVQYLTNKEIASKIDSSDTAVSRSLKSLNDQEYLTISIENNTKRCITILPKLANTLIKKTRVTQNNDETPLPKSQGSGYERFMSMLLPLTKKSRGLPKSQGLRFNPLILFLRPLSKSQGGGYQKVKGVTKKSRVWKVQVFENKDFEGDVVLKTTKMNSKKPLYIYYINIYNNIFFKKKGCGEKTKPYQVEVDSEGIASCRKLHEKCNEYHKEHPGKYPKELYKKFIHHWSEPNEKGVPKWYRERQKKGSWQLAGRLATWANSPYNSQVKSTSQDPEKGKIQKVLEVSAQAEANLRARMSNQNF